MNFLKVNTLLVLLLLGLIATSCGDEDDGTSSTVDNFNRTAMLTFWADDVIIPAYEAFDATLDNFVTAKDVFVAEPSDQNLDNLQTTWLASYKSWQSVAMFDIGKAEEIGYRNFMNIYPTDVDLIEEHISTGEYNLILPSTFDAQGFPALDYLLFGMDDTMPLDVFSQPNRLAYISDLVDRMKSLNDEVLSDWTDNNFRETFIENDGSSATASTDKMVNDFLFYFERFFRAGKIGIPAGVFSGNEISAAVEAPFSSEYSKELFLTSFDAIQSFFTGLSFDKSTTGLSLQQYLTDVAQNNESSDISILILNQWESVENSAQSLKDNFKEQVEEDNLKMRATYDEIQGSVVLLKVDMMSALNIQVDFVDADGD